MVEKAMLLDALLANVLTVLRGSQLITLSQEAEIQMLQLKWVYWQKKNQQFLS